ncbi:hypothetical protein LCGC14_1099160 [marine sediment metagenome]|uniref:Uncharacterized protein n=1 Tax=marine sediment metagenome TaxID=412755 RepID=A0A0F9QG47_9ZZZZ
MAEHTGEPWVAGDNEMGDYTIWEGTLEEVGEVIAAVKEKANAFRIAAAINACKDIPIEALEDGVVEKTVRACRLVAAFGKKHPWTGLGDSKGYGRDLQAILEAALDKVPK